MDLSSCQMFSFIFSKRTTKRVRNQEIHTQNYITSNWIDLKSKPMQFFCIIVALIKCIGNIRTNYCSLGRDFISWFLLPLVYVVFLTLNIDHRFTASSYFFSFKTTLDNSTTANSTVSNLKEFKEYKISIFDKSIS